MKYPYIISWKTNKNDINQGISYGKDRISVILSYKIFLEDVFRDEKPKIIKATPHITPYKIVFELEGYGEETQYWPCEEILSNFYKRLINNKKIKYVKCFINDKEI